MIKLFKKLFNSFRHSFRGLRYAYREELSFRMEVWAGLILLAIGYVAWPLKAWEFFALIFSYIFILVIELLNTALERALERLHPERHALIGASKDIASAAVLLAVLFACTIAVFILAGHYYAPIFEFGLL